MQSPTQDDLYLRFLGSLIEELGAKMYPSVTASVAELISNAWDADAHNVWVTMPLGRRVDKDGGDAIVVIDDGVGMTRTEAQLKYLIVGRKRRLEEQRWTSLSGRSLHGRKGIGKLAAFGTAKLLECTTWTEDAGVTAFELDYDAIRNLGPGENYRVNEYVASSIPNHPVSGNQLKHGTKIRLSSLLSKVIPTESQFRQSLARRFGILNPEMNVFLNGKQIERFEIPVDIRFPRDGIPEPGKGLPRRNQENGDAAETVKLASDWAVESLPDGEVRWWIGFTPKPIEAADLRGISVLAHRKMVQRPFMFGRSQGTAGQLGQEYLVGEVVADWIDDNIDSEDDLVETNRNELQLEDERLQSFLAWGRARLRWALALRSELRPKKIVRTVLLNDDVQSRLQEFTPSEQRDFQQIADKLSKMSEVDASDVSDILLDLLDSYDDKSIRGIIQHIKQESEPVQERMWALVAEFGLIDARRTATKMEGRMQVILKLEELVEGGAPEVPDIHQHIVSNPWLLDPRWELYGDEVNLTKMLREKHGYEPESNGNRADYLFALGAENPTSADETIVVEIKRGTNRDGSINRVTQDEVLKFASYVEDANSYYTNTNSPENCPTVRGLMVASGYTQQANNQRVVLQRVPGGVYQFKSWQSVLRDTRRLHLWWLEGSSRRAGSGR